LRIAIAVPSAVPSAFRSAAEWCRVRGLNSRPTVYKTAALPLS
jgi:hypothetical protein